MTRRAEINGLTMAWRWHCPGVYFDDSIFQHDSGNGVPPRQKCRRCGRPVTAEFGRWGVFEWTEKNRYPLSNALANYSREKSAQDYADRLNFAGRERCNDLVVRWIPGSEFATVSDKSVSITGEVSPM